MDLQIATHFSHGGLYSKSRTAQILKQIAESGADGIRDGLAWSRVETSKGVYDFSNFRESYAAAMADAGVEVTLSLLPGGNDLYDGGKTVYSQKGIAAFAAYVVAVAKEFPDVGTITIGNEFNGLNSAFVNGKVATKDIEARVAYYTSIVKAVSEALDAEGLDVTLAGGALHSMATGYVQAMVDAGTFAYIDTLDFHPYGEDPTEIAQSLERLNSILDTLPEDQRPDLVVTEFGASADADDPLSNASYLAKMAAVLGAGGVSSAAWYALYDEDTSGTPDMGLYDTPTVANDMLEGFQFVASLLDSGTTPTQVEAGAGLEVYDFGNGTWLVWGSAQTVAFGGKGLTFRDASGAIIDTPTTVTDTPVFVSGTNLSVEGTSGILADSFYDFELDADPDGPWSYHALKIKSGVETEIALEVMDGQTRMSEIWNPYLGNSWSRPLRISADTLLPAAMAANGKNDRATVERFTAEDKGEVDIVASWAVSEESKDGIVVEIRVNGSTLAMETVTETFTLAVRSLSLNAGDQVDFIVHDGANAKGDYTTRHIRILTADSTLTTDALLAEHLANDIIEATDSATTLVLGEVEETAKSSAPSTGALFDDVQTGTAGKDRLTADRDSTAASLSGGSGNDLLRGRSGDDLLGGGAGNDKLVGAAGKDTLRGGDGKDTLNGGDGADTLFGDDGVDKLSGGDGDDWMNGGAGNDALAGGDGADTLFGEGGADKLTGGNGDDSLDGGDGKDKLSGGNGDDTLTGGTESDKLTGGAGADVFVFNETDARDLISDFSLAEGDQLDLSALGLTADDLTFTQKGTSVELSVTLDGEDVTLALLRNINADALEASDAVVL